MKCPKPLVLLIILMLTALPMLAKAGIYTFDSSIPWLLPAYSTQVGFNQNYTLDTFYWDTAGATIYFTNFTLGSGGNVSLIGFSSQNGNMTVTNVFNAASTIDFSLIGTNPITSSIIFASTPANVTLNGLPTSYVWDGISNTTVIVPATSGNVEITYGSVLPVPSNFTQSFTYHFPTWANIVAPASLRVHFGTEWVLSTSTPMRMSCWLSTGWLNYTVDNAGSQQIYYANHAPTLVIIDGSTSSAYTNLNGLTTISIATSSVAVDYGTPPPLPPVYSLFFQVFPTYLSNSQVTVNGTTYMIPYVLTSSTINSWQMNATQTLNYSTSTYLFSSWLINGTTLNTSPSLTLANVENTTLQVNYVQSAIYIWPSGGIPITFHLRNNIISTLNTLGYALDIEGTSRTVTSPQTISGEYSSLYGFRVWVINYDNSTSEITPGYPIATIARTTNGAGMFLSYWDSPSTSTINSPFGVVDALMLQVYQEWGSNGWNLAGTYVTDPNLLFKLAGGTWTFRLYTNYTDNFVSCTSSFSWGDKSSTDSAVSLYIVYPSEFELQEYHLSIGDLVAFTMDPFAFPIRMFSVNLAGSIVWAVIALILAVTLWIRNDSLTATALIFALFGGGGGILNGFIPAFGLGITWAFFAFGLALLFFRLVKGRSYAE